MNRRRALQVLGAGAGLAGTGFLAGRAWLPPRPSRHLADVDELARRLFASLEGEARERACVPYDHPLRQYWNRGVDGGGLPVDLATLDREQRGLVADLLGSGLSPAGRERVPRQFFLRWPGVHVLRLLVCGDPTRPPWQIVLTGPHLNLRIGGASREGIPFGGPQVYGDQRGDGRPGLPGNVYAYQLQLAREVWDELDERRRLRALLPEAPYQTWLEPPGPEAPRRGLAATHMPGPARAALGRLVEGILSTYPAEDAAFARRCLERNGGDEALSIAWFADGRVTPDGPLQVFRVEGPGAVLHFRGAPHVHAFVNVLSDPARPLSVGEPVGDNPRVLVGEDLRRFFEDALRRKAGTEVAYYAPEDAVGRLRAGPLREGDLYVAEAWQDEALVCEVRGAGAGPALRGELLRSGIAWRADRIFQVATTRQVLHAHSSERLGEVVARHSLGLVREALVAHARAHGFARRS